jgi:hypothetical protein
VLEKHAKPRVQCDLAQPFCQRCTKYGVTCPGYRSEQELIFRVSTGASVAKTSKRGRKPSETINGKARTLPFNPMDAADDATSSAVMAMAVGRASPPLLIQVQESWKEHSVPLVMQYYEKVEFITEVYRSTPNDECLTMASHLFARAFMANHFLAPMDVGEMQRYLGKALAAVADAIQDPVKSVMDSTIAAVWLLGNYEVSLFQQPEWRFLAYGVLRRLWAR